MRLQPPTVEWPLPPRPPLELPAWLLWLELRLLAMPPPPCCYMLPAQAACPTSARGECGESEEGAKEVCSRTTHVEVG